LAHPKITESFKQARNSILPNSDVITPASVTIGIHSEDESIPLPQYATHEAAGFDLCSSINITIKPKTHCLIPTGLHMEIPRGYHVEIRSRSGLAAKNGVFVLNSPGTIDSDYTGEICIILCNLGSQSFHVSKGDRIAQAVVMKHEIASLVRVDQIEKETERGEGGFGSTGV
jgi:dUTP pyrophosphatase